MLKIGIQTKIIKAAKDIRHVITEEQDKDDNIFIIRHNAKEHNGATTLRYSKRKTMNLDFYTQQKYLPKNEGWANGSRGSSCKLSYPQRKIKACAHAHMQTHKHTHTAEIARHNFVRTLEKSQRFTEPRE